MKTVKKPQPGTLGAVIEAISDFIFYEPELPSDTYVVTYFCDNCRKDANIRFKKGTSAPEHGLKCPHCETRDTRTDNSGGK